MFSTLVEAGALARWHSVIDQLHLGRAIKDVIGNCFANLDTGDAGDDVVQTLQMLDVEGGDDIDPGVAKLGEHGVEIRDDEVHHGLLPRRPVVGVLAKRRPDVCRAAFLEDDVPVWLNRDPSTGGRPPSPARRPR